MKKQFYLLSLSFLFFLSCATGDNSNSSANTNLKKIIYQSSDGHSSNENYEYDGNGNLIRSYVIIDSDSDKFSIEVLYSRNSNNKINFIEKRYYGETLEKAYGLRSKTTEDYTIDNNNKYVSMIETKTTYYLNEQVEINNVTFLYSNDKLTNINYANGNYKKYDYDSIGNLIYVEEYIANEQNKHIENMVYDNMTAPIQINDEIAIPFISQNNIESFSYINKQNDIITETGSYSNSYIYNNQNKPVSSTRISSNKTQTSVSYIY